MIQKEWLLMLRFAVVLIAIASTVAFLGYGSLLSNSSEGAKISFFFSIFIILAVLSFLAGRDQKAERLPTERRR